MIFRSPQITSISKAKYAWVVLLLLLTEISMGQTQTASKLERKEGDRYFQGLNYTMALKEYLPLLNKYPDDPELNYAIGASYLKGAFKTKALTYLEKAIQLSEKPSEELRFDYATALHFNLKFDEAMKHYQASDPMGTNRGIVARRINECMTGKKLVAAPVKAIITNMGGKINTIFNEYRPFITADMLNLYFTSRRPNTTGGKKDKDGQFFEDIYGSRNQGFEWGVPKQLPSPLNSSDHDALIGISPDGQTMYLYRGKNGGDIFVSEKNGKEWSNPEPFPWNTEHFESSVCLSHDGNSLYFVSDRRGNKDIYVCRKRPGGNWSPPLMMNNNINTAQDEESPFASADGKWLYFSSKGQNTMGGYDIFRVPINTNGGIGMPENLGYPINTPMDDLNFVISPDGKWGYFSSEKEDGFGLQDLYLTRMPPPPKDLGVTVLSGTVKDGKSNMPTQAYVTVTDNDANEVITSIKSDAETGNFVITLPAGKNYGIAVEKDKRLFFSENVNLPESGGFVELKKQISLPEISTGALVALRNLFFDVNAATLQKTSFPELNRVIKFLKDNPSVKIEIAGHTDNSGSDAINKPLSEKRAQAVFNYLKTNGIVANRMVAKGYGSSKPVASNTNEDGKAQNRRTEIKIIGT